MSRHLYVIHWDCCLGAGSEGEIFLGRSLDSGELCAVKVSTSLDPAAARAQLRAELQRCLRVAGDGVVGLVAWNLEAEPPFLVFELAHAGTLADEISNLRGSGTVYHPVSALERIRDVLVSLSSVHARGLVHRDVKPANLLRFGDALKLTDFGSASTVEERAAHVTDGFVGTRLYASPEQLDERSADERSDLYAVGCILHEMVTGEVPGSEGLDDDPARYPNALVLPDLDRLLRSLLAREPGARPADAKAAIGDVDRVLAAYAAAREAWQRLELGPSPY